MRGRLALPWLFTLAFSIVFLLDFSIPLLAKNPAMKSAKKEAEQLAKEANSQLQKNLKNENTGGFSDQDILPLSDQGKKFEISDSQFKNASNNLVSSEVSNFLSHTKKPEQLEENEEFLVNHHQIIEHPLPSTDIVSLKTALIPEEENLQKCQESGTYQCALTQALTVQASPAIKETIRHCKGHQHSKDYQYYDTAKKRRVEKENDLKKNTEIATYAIHRHNTTITSSWKHHDNAGSCDHFTTEEKVIQEGHEEEVWSFDDPTSAALLESNPSCKLLYTQVTPGPETRIINGKAVSRDVWSRRLHFSVEPLPDSPCAKLRAEGGILIHKKCLTENHLGECDFWEKTYDLGKRGVSQLTTGSFKDEELWGLDQEFDTSYEKNRDFGGAISTLSIFSDLENQLENQGSDVQGKIQIFKGEKFKCQKSFLAGDVFDCCKNMDGLAVNIKLAKCSTQEQCLAQNRTQGKCHFVGSQKAQLGTVSEHVYCCFPSQLARVIHEQGRKQLGIKWGSAEKPKCRGLKLEELQRIDFSLVDFSEVVASLPINQKAFEQKIQNSIAPLQRKVQEQIQHKRKEATFDPLNTNCGHKIVHLPD